MRKPPKITQVLRTAADWPLWIQQVNSRLLALELGDCLSMNAAGDLELSPPKLPAKVPDQIRHTAAHEARLLERETKYLQYIKLQKDYLSFMLAVQKSIGPKIGLDPSEDRSFGTLIRALKNHFGLNGSPAVAPSAKARDGWSVVIRQDLRTVSAGDWGETLLKAHRSARKRGVDGFEGWRPHVEFVEHVKRFYPHLDGALDVYLDGIQEDEGDTPRKKSLERLVQFWVKMVSRQGVVALVKPLGCVVAKSSGKGASKYPDGVQKPGSLSGLQHGRNEGEPDTPNALERKRKEHNQDDEASEPAKKKARKLPATEEEKKALAREEAKKTAAKDQAMETPAKDKFTTSLKKEVSHLSLAQIPGSPSLFVTGTTPNASPRESQVNNDGDYTMSGTLQFRGEGSGGLSSSAVTSLAIQAKSTIHKTSVLSQLASLEPRRQGLGVNHQKEDTVSKPQMQNGEGQHGQNVSSEGDSDGRCHACRKLDHPTEDCPLLEQYRVHGESSTQMTVAAKARCKEWLGMKDGPISVLIPGQLLKCFICEEIGHGTGTCRFLALHRENDGVTRLLMTKLRRDRCITWLRNESRLAVVKVALPPKKKCGVCEIDGHATEACRFLDLYRVYGEATQGLDDVTKERCKAWIKGAGGAVEGGRDESVAGCEACGEEGHLSVDYESLQLDLTTGRESHVSESTKKGSGALGQDISESIKKGTQAPRIDFSENTKDGSRAPRQESPTGTYKIQCDVCGSVGHQTLMCPFLILYKAQGEGASMAPTTKERCRQALKLGEIGKLPVCDICKDDHLADRCSDQRAYWADRCSDLRAYWRHGDHADIPMAAKDRCHEWLMSARSGLGPARGRLGPHLRCAMCCNRGHLEADCFYLRKYRIRGEGTSSLREDIKRKCREWEYRERSTR